MYLANYLNKLIREDGFILVDANLNNYVIGNPKKQNPIKLKLLDKNLHYKLLLYPDLFLGEAYSNGSAVIENGTLTEFLDIAFKNVGRNKTSTLSEFLNKLRGTYRFLTNFNLKKKSKSNVVHHYDISENLYDLFLLCLNIS